MSLKRIITTIVCALCVNVAAYCQYGVLGLRFGSTKEEAMEYFRSRFGYGVAVEDGYKISMNDIRYAGIEFRFLEFRFIWVNNKTYFNSASFGNPIELCDVEAAKTAREIIIEELKKKYTYIEEYVNSDGFKCYKFGENPNNPNNVTGSLVIFKGKGKEGKDRLYLNVNYFPFIEESTNDL